MADADKFFQETKEPVRFQEAQDRVKKFVRYHDQRKTPIVLVTSTKILLQRAIGRDDRGTTVPLEDNTVRFIDNFSIGTRGSSSAEYFLECGFAVIFLHRARSLAPFTRHLPGKSLLDILDVEKIGDKTQLKVKDESTPSLVSVIQKYKKVQQEQRLLHIEFTSLSDYLHLLRACSLALASLGNRAVLYLAAAVSDFYIPKDKMPQHKIQSSEGPLQLSLELVPKMLGPLVKDWAPLAFVVSFKLETDHTLLLGKARTALEKYQHQVVIGNVLETRKKEVVVITRDCETKIQLDSNDIKNSVEIEQKIIKHLIELFHSFGKINK